MKFHFFPDILTPNGLGNFIIDSMITIGLTKLWSKRSTIIQEAKKIYFESVFFHKTLKFGVYLRLNKANQELDNRTCKALVDSIFAQAKINEKEATNGFNMFAPLFKQVYPEWWKQQFGDQKIAYIKRDDGEVIYL